MSVTINGISQPIILRNAAPAVLYQEAIKYEAGSAIAASGALVALSGEKTGRSPKDKRVVKHPDSAQNIWWGDINRPLPEASHIQLRDQAITSLNETQRLYVVDGFAGWDTQYRLKIRIITSRPYHALFMHNMLIRPNEAELANFGEPDYVVYNAGHVDADQGIEGVTSNTSVSLSFEHREMVIFGTEYAGEMKKGVFTILNYLMPLQQQLPMHCSATAEINSERSAVLFGLSGTGKTTLSADPNRELIGDDEHVWTDTGIFNIEGGCYAKVIDLSAEKEPEIYGALGFGSVLENVKFNDQHQVDYSDVSITQNTRGCYPVEAISNARIPCLAGHPSDIVFLTCDAFGVLPPVAKLSPEQAMFHFISGYTAKVAGTEMGVTEPEATFSACFGAPFMVWHPTKYAELLAQKMQQHKVNVWLVNTGWSGGAYGVGSRIKLAYSRAIIDAINAGELANAPSQTDSVFGFEIITKCTGVPDNILIPKNAWADQSAYEKQAKSLAAMFNENFTQYAAQATDAIKSAAPKG
ncbi:phosphoenolpyruvate carboxykinase (ATP) [Ostreibacterium oceani]|uniref:Phosphoenolpyruvate carboxykinase (ATP) n=1 Tax=Ostreibacterium oceani TaxID=2654998 RepID=A0A6N7EUF7_9GAMM|nr:phosphoenolpyruvate carboxykinase (ATP) [Ostreibacterium oceani]MPV86072.1 phosphoenolpyruvate carboxykinase (ATP) [Ostreibacterium oceani]